MIKLLLCSLRAQQLTPPPGDAPCSNGPWIYGCRPGHPFIYRVPCIGERPIRFSARHLPAGLTQDKNTGVVSGSSPGKRGEYIVTLQAKNAHGSAKRKFKIVAGDTPVLTPPNSMESLVHALRPDLRQAVPVRC
jgi:alpha-galactosidase